MTSQVPVTLNPDAYIKVADGPTVSSFYLQSATGAIEYRIEATTWAQDPDVAGHRLDAGRRGDNVTLLAAESIWAKSEDGNPAILVYTGS